VFLHVIDQSSSAETHHSRPDHLLDGYIFDLDGTIYLGDELLPGARRLVGALRTLDRKVLFLSNNPTKDPEEYAAKLNRMGIAATPGNILNTVTTTVDWFRRFHPDATVFPISEAPLIRALDAAGIRMSDNPEEIDFVIASYDRTFDYRKLQIAFDAIAVHRRARLVSTNPDRFCPFPGGRGEPDAAAIVGAIEGCTGARCEQTMGKPDPFMLDAALTRLGLAAPQCVMIGDRLMTDIRMAVDAGMPSALVLTGETTLETLAHHPTAGHPKWVLGRIDDILPASAWSDQ
jgi:HAD superfamily hydrolase (TIGR01450 family)